MTINSTDQPECNLLEALTAREEEILPLYAQGLSDREIADQLVIGPTTVKWYNQRIYDKLGLERPYRKRRWAVHCARQLGLLAGAAGEIVAAAPGDNPYKGLDAFHLEDADSFFGREALSEILTTRLSENGTTPRFLAVVGPSGSGKSSVVRAGLLPALAADRIPGASEWTVAGMYPRVNPFHELEASLQRVAVKRTSDLLSILRRDAYGLSRTARLILPDEQPLLLVIDQFEELFTLVDDVGLAREFLDLVYGAVTDPRSTVRVVITLRADFLDRPLMYPDFSWLVQERTAMVVPLTPDELERAITLPAKQANVQIETGVVAQLVAEANEQPGALPLLQFALTELFDNHVSGVITLERYEEIGGLQKTLAAQAEKIFESLDESQQETARQIFLRLITLGEGAEDTRRRAPLSELTETADASSSAYVVEYLAANRLLTTDIDPATREPSVEVAHEALIREWERLRGWLEESRVDIRMQRLLNHAATQWARGRRDESYLLRGARLTQYAGWSEETDIALSDAERAYLQASLREEERRERRLRRIRNAALSVAITVAVVMGFLALAAVNERDKANEASAESLSVALSGAAREAFDKGDRGLALALAIESVNIVREPLSQVQRTLTDIAYAPGLRREMVDADAFPATTDNPYPNHMNGVAVSPDGQYALAGMGGLAYEAGGQANVALWDLNSGELVHRFDGHPRSVVDVAFNADGLTAFSAGWNAEIIQWDLASLSERQRIDPGSDQTVQVIAPHPDGDILGAGGCIDWNPEIGCSAHGVTLFDLTTGEMMLQVESEFFFGIFALMFSPDGDSFYVEGVEETSEGLAVHLLKYATDDGRELLDAVYPRTDQVKSGDVSPDGERILLGYRAGLLSLVDSETGEELLILEGDGVAGRVMEVSFSPDGQTALTAHQTGQLIHWDLATGEPLDVFPADANLAWDVAWTPDGLRAVTGGNEGALRLWDIAQGNESRRYDPEGIDSLWDLDLSPDGQTLMLTSGREGFEDIAPPAEDRSILFWDIGSGEEIRRFGGHPIVAWHAAFSPDGLSALSAAGTHDPMRLWDVETGDTIQRFANDYGVYHVSFSPDGNTAVYSGRDGSVRLWDVATGVETQRIVASGLEATSAALSPYGSLLLTGDRQGNVYLWDLDTGEKLREFEGHGNRVDTLVFLPDQRHALSAAQFDRIIIWDLDTGESVREYGALGTGRVALSGDYQRAAYNTPDHSVILLDLSTGEELARFSGHRKQPVTQVFGPDGDRIYSTSWDGTLREWVTPASTPDEIIDWARQNRVVPALTAEQRILYRLDPAVGTGPDRFELSADSPLVDAAANRTPTATVVPTAQPEARQATPGEQRGEITRGGVDRWLYDGRAGEMLSIRVIADEPLSPDFSGSHDDYVAALESGSRLEAFVAVFTPDGAPWFDSYTIFDPLFDLDAFASGNARFEGVELPADGVYIFEVRGFGYLSGGAYTLVLEQEDG